MLGFYIWCQLVVIGCGLLGWGRSVEPLGPKSSAKDDPLEKGTAVSP